MKACDPQITMRAFGVSATEELLQRASEAVRIAGESPNAEAVHKMRVSIRRLQQSLRLFHQYFNKRGVKKVRRDLKRIMDPAGELRNHDIALRLVRRSGGNAEPLIEQRLSAKRALREVLAGVAEKGTGEQWRSILGLEPNEEKAVEG